MKTTLRLWVGIVFSAAVLTLIPAHAADSTPGLTLARDGHWLVIRGAQIPAGEIRINYLEAYCRAGSTDADWREHTVIKHTNELVSLDPAGKVMKLRDVLTDGLGPHHQFHPVVPEAGGVLEGRLGPQRIHRGSRKTDLDCGAH